MYLKGSSRYVILEKKFRQFFSLGLVIVMLQIYAYIFCSNAGKTRSVSERSSSVNSHSDVEETITTKRKSLDTEHINQSSQENEDNTQKVSDEADKPKNAPAHYKSIERKCAREFMSALSELVVHLLTLLTNQDVDEAIQTFSSEHAESKRIHFMMKLLQQRLKHYHKIPHFDAVMRYSCGKHCEKRRNCLCQTRTNPKRFTISCVYK